MLIVAKQEWKTRLIATLIVCMLAFQFFFNPYDAQAATGITHQDYIGGYQTPPIENPTGIDVDSSGNVYVVDTGNSRIMKYDNDGNYLSTFGTAGSGNGQFSGPKGIRLDPLGNIYVVDTGNARIQKFDSDGNFLTKWGSSGMGNGQFNSAYGIEIDSSSNVYVVENNAHRVQKFDSNGNFLTKWGSYGTAPGQFIDPRGIAIDSNGDIYVSEIYIGTSRVQKFDSNGTHINQWSIPNLPNAPYSYGLAFDSNDYLYITDYQNLIIRKYDNTMTYVSHWPMRGWDNTGSINSQFITIDSNDNIFITDTNESRIVKFDTGGNVLTR